MENTPFRLIVKSFICFVFFSFGNHVFAQKKHTAPLNILLFTADDLDRNSLGCFGSTVAGISPNIDHFASQSLKFTKAFVNSAICVPSRAVIATGLYAHNNSVNGFYKIKPEKQGEVPLIMEILRSYGYTLGILGKLDHSTPKQNFKWDFEFDEHQLGNGRSPSLYYDRAKDFFFKMQERQ